jgi:hypothetical protein
MQGAPIVVARPTQQHVQVRTFRRNEMRAKLELRRRAQCLVDRQLLHPRVEDDVTIWIRLKSE